MFRGSNFNEKHMITYEFARSKLIKIQYEIPKPFPLEDYVSLSIEREKGFNSLIYKEIMLYNNLITRINENLEETLLAIDGIRLSNTRTDNTFECLQNE